MFGDLQNLKEAADLVCTITNLPFKDVVQTVVDEFAEKFPSEVDFTIEAGNLEHAAALIERRGFERDIAVPRVHRTQARNAHTRAPNSGSNLSAPHARARSRQSAC